PRPREAQYTVSRRDPKSEPAPQIFGPRSPAARASSRACSGTGFAPTRTMRILALAFAIAALGCNEHGSTPCTGQNCCHTSADCKQTFEQCFEPGADIGCGACQVPPNTCQVDTECATQGPTAICSVARCTCNGEKSCIAGCADDAGCPEGTTCGPDHRCAPMACGNPPPCPDNFDGMRTGTCIRRACTTASACTGGCVNGRCFDMLGFCSAPPA